MLADPNPHETGVLLRPGVNQVAPPMLRGRIRLLQGLQEQIALIQCLYVRRETSRVSFLMYPFCVRGLSSL
jgi:hypothetical protein